MILGIDLGTTNSLISVFTEEGAKIIPNRMGEKLTPSVVSVDEEGMVYVGEVAKERLALYPDTAAHLFKRTMGSEKKYMLSGKEYTSEELASFILKSLKEDAEHYLGETVEEVIISVPAYFNEARRRATKRAGELANLRVERIISEPTAAAIAYGLYQAKDDAKFLVFDFGGGTFDISIIELYKNILEVKAVAGDNFLGGENFTDVLEDLFCKEHALEKETLSQKEKSQLHKQAEKCKKQFSTDKTAKFTFIHNEKMLESDINMKEYEDACESLLEEIKKPIKRSLADAKIKLSEIDKVVLVGGATKLPIIRRFVAKVFLQMPDISVNPDEAVAIGAAIQGAMKERNKQIKEIILTDVCPFTLGTEVVVQKNDNYYEPGHFFPIIERNTIIPASRTERLFTVRDNQTRITVDVLQGESRYTANNVLLGKLQVTVPKAKAGEEAIDVTYTYDINSLLEVEVLIVSTGERTKKVIKGQDVNMSDEEIEERLKELAYLKVPPREQEENKYLLLKAENLYEQSLGIDREVIEDKIRAFEKVLDTQNPTKISEARKILKEFLEFMDNPL